MVWQARLSFGAEADAVDVEAFFDWLQRTPSLHGVSNIGMESRPGARTMSAGDIITVASSGVTALTGIVSAYAAWRASRAAAPAVQITIAGFETVTIVNGTEAEVRSLVEKLRADDDSATGPA